MFVAGLVISRGTEVLRPVNVSHVSLTPVCAGTHTQSGDPEDVTKEMLIGDVGLSLNDSKPAKLSH